MSTTLDEAKDDLLQRAAEVCVHAPGLREGRVGEALAFLRQYYLHVAPEDILSRDPLDVYGPAMAHRQLGEERPQGRALVRVFSPTIEEHGWDPGHTVVQIVTDDMPYLVDSVTMELTRLDIGTHLIVHPQFRVRRDVTGHLLEVCGAPTGAAGAEELDESWMHIEIDRQAGDADLGRIGDNLLRVLADVRYAVEDTPKMQAVARRIAEEFGRAAPPLPAAEVDDAIELLRWLADGNFTFVGYREYDLVEGEHGEALRAIPGTGLGVLRGDIGGSDSFAALPPPVRAKAREPHPLVLTKANSRSTVHRPYYLDYIGVKRFDDTGAVVGERRFLGLYSHAAYTESITRIPVLKHKLAEVLERSGFPPDSHDGKDLVEILESYPRDELFQVSVEQLLPIALGVLRMHERRQTRLFLRRDDYGRFMSCLVYLPRDRYTTEIRLRMQQILIEAFHGTTLDYRTMVSESVLARLHFVVRVPRGAPIPDVDPDDLERRLVAATRSWTDDLSDAILEQCGEERAPALRRRYGRAFPEGYKADFPARTAVADLKRLETLTSPDDIALNLYEPYDALPGERRLKIYRVGRPISLSEVLPKLQHMGVEVVDERPYEIDRAVIEQPAGRQAEETPLDRAWIYDFGLRYEEPDHIDAAHLKELFQQALIALWRGEAESDRFNALVLRAGLTWREAMVLRAYAKYLRQIRTTFSQHYIEQVLIANPGIARALVRLFASRFDPRLRDGREERSQALAEEIRSALDEVRSLDADRILRTYLAMIEATLRTNYFCPARPYLALKIDPQRVPDLPAPRPRREIFVYSPRVEAVHLRFGPVARGGLRWSDRLEDFRTEILGLVKAQTVKNAVIVPTGAKGGFVVKRLPRVDGPGGREALMTEVVACYRQFISGLLDLTDNLVKGEVVPPPDVVRHDGDDAYLVVAADKGTATFSDIANEVAAEYGYWLGDAFASGGSAGYDHKAMGITARGAFESVRYHLRELGVDVRNEDVTVVGIGDMSGDVFGNGMLLSRHYKLVAAFDHRHIFLDPDPDPERSWRERRRLFELPRSSWADYDPALISAGGGVYPRDAKSIPLTPQVRRVLGVADDVSAVTPQEMIKAILAAPVDLLWNGGIGTYVKASSESHADVGDKANDAVRIDATRLRCRVVVEGGNLGLTQLARIEYALAGGRVNTDFIDNSAGVDTSDHEVNIKILLDRVVRDGDLTKKQRDQLLARMTEEVADLVLADNRHQNVVLAAARAQAPAMLHVHARYLRKLEREGHLDRRIEFLPSDKVIAERRSAGLGLTSPEFCSLLAYTKITLSEALLASDLPDDPYLRRTLVGYFPTPLRARFDDRMDDHPLRREIITTCIVNDLVNRSGITFAFRMNEETGASAADIARAYLVAHEVFDMRAFWQAVEGLDHVVDTATQIAMLLEGRRLVERVARWLLHNRRPPFDIARAVAFFADSVAAITPKIPAMLAGRDLAGFAERRDSFIKRGVPADLAERVAVMVPAYATFDLVEIARGTGHPVEEVAEVYFDLADRLQLARLREQVLALPREDRWTTMARSALRDDLYAAHAALTRDVLVTCDAGTPEQRLAAWADKNATAVARAGQTLSEIWESERFTVATLSIALRAIRMLVTSSTLPLGEEHFQAPTAPR